MEIKKLEYRGYFGVLIRKEIDCFGGVQDHFFGHIYGLEENNPVLFEGATEEQAEQDFKWLIDYYVDRGLSTKSPIEKISNKNKGEQIMNSSTQSPWVEVTFTEALDFYNRQMRYANAVQNEQKSVNVDGRSAKAVEFQNGSLLAVTADGNQNQYHKDDWEDYGEAVPRFWVKDAGLRND